MVNIQDAPDLIEDTDFFDFSGLEYQARAMQVLNPLLSIGQEGGYVKIFQAGIWNVGIRKNDNWEDDFTTTYRNELLGDNYRRIRWIRREGNKIIINPQYEGISESRVLISHKGFTGKKEYTLFNNDGKEIPILDKNGSIIKKPVLSIHPHNGKVVLIKEVVVIESKPTIERSYFVRVAEDNGQISANELQLPSRDYDNARISLALQRILNVPTGRTKSKVCIYSEILPGGVVSSTQERETDWR